MTPVPAAERAAAVPGRVAVLGWTILVGLVAVALCSPFLRAVFWLGDEGVLLAGADRMLHGSRLYADFFEFLPPGGFVITAAWLGIAGVSMWSARILAMATIAGIACFTYLACRSASKNALYPAIVVIAWLVMTQGYWTEISHHWFTTLFSMIAAWAALRHIDRPQPSLGGPILAGLAAGAAAMVVPTRGALAMLAAASVIAGSRAPWRHLAAYVLAGAVVPVGLVLYLVVQQALIPAFDDVILFAASRYASIQGVPFGYFANLQNWPLTYLFPVAALAALAACACRWPTPLRDRRLLTCAAFGVAGFIGCFPRPDLAHIAFAAPLALPLLTYGARQATKGALRRYRRAVAAFAIALSLPSGFAYWLIAEQALRSPLLPTPRGDVAFFDDVRAAGPLVARIAATPAGDAYFFYPLMPLLSFLTDREQVSKHDLFTPGYTLPSQYREACLAVMRQASWVVIDRNWTRPDFLQKIFPALQNPRRNEAQRFEEALQSGFGLVERYGPFELRQRDAGRGPSDCAAIAG